MLTQGKTKQIWREDSEHAFQSQLFIKNLTCRTVGHASASEVFSQAKKIFGLQQTLQKMRVWVQLKAFTLLISPKTKDVAGINAN